MPATHPIRLIVNDDLQRTRLTVFFRLILAIPLLALGGALGRDRAARVHRQLVRDAVHGPVARRPAQLPRHVPPLHDARPRLHAAGRRPLSALHRQGGHLPDRPRDRPARSGRTGWTVFFRGILAIPALFLSNLLSQLNQLLAIFSWFIALVTGRVPEGIRNFAALAMRIETQTYAYALLLTSRYPSFNVGIES